MADHNRLDEVIEWLATMDRSGLRNTPKLVKSWDSRTSTLYRFSCTDEPQDTIVKVHMRPTDARAHFESMRRVAASLVSSPVADHDVLKPINYSDSLGAVAMPFIDGHSVADILMQSSLPFRDRYSRLLKILDSCGRVLARYHEATKAPKGSVPDSAVRNLRTRLEYVFGNDGATFEPHGKIAQSYGDFHPGHVLVTRDNRLALLDPPLDIKYNYIYRDIAVFDYNLFILLAHPRVQRRGAALRPGYARSLIESFLGGYAAELGQSFSMRDRFFINTYEAFLLSRRISAFESDGARAGVRLWPLRFRLAKLRAVLRDTRDVLGGDHPGFVSQA